MPKLAKIIFTAWAACICAAARAADFSAQIVPTTQDAEMEWWFNLPANSVPHVIQCDRVLFHQNFALAAFFDNADVKNGKFDITYSIFSTSPDGKRTAAAENVKLAGAKISKGIIGASDKITRACFDKNSPAGKYTFELVAKDEVSGKTATARASVELAEWNPPEPLEGRRAVDAAILGFYKNPAPEVLYSLFYSKDLNLEQRGAPHEINYIYAGFFRAGFLRNSFLAPYLRRAFPKMSPLDRAKTIFIFALTDEARIDFNILTESERKYQDAMRKADIPAPYAEWDPALGAAQIDMLWGEFFADGTYKPIRRIMSLLAYSKEGAFAEEMLAARRKPATAAEWKKLMLGACHNAAKRSLLANAERFELVRKYCAWALENGDVPEAPRGLLGEISENKAAEK